MERAIQKFILGYRGKNRKRFNINELQNYLIEHYKGDQQYLENGGYPELHRQMLLLKSNNCIREIESSGNNGLNPHLKVRWQIVFKDDIPLWSQSKMLQLSDLLDFGYYINNPSYQTEQEWEYAGNIYRFLKSRDGREWASIEERSLELFYDEKFLIGRQGAGKRKYGILTRLKLSYEDLKMKKYGEMFVYWNRGVESVRNIIILENHSAFFTYKRMEESHGRIFGFIPDALIYGEGKKIESSFSFIEEIADIGNAAVLYFGDIDPEGFGIYCRLKERYPGVNIRLQHKAYLFLLTLCGREYPSMGQNKNRDYLNYFLEEMKEHLTEEQIEQLHYIWERDLRIPQELINYENLLKVKE
jgi:hypothetical protein